MYPLTFWISLPHDVTDFITCTRIVFTAG